MMVAMYESDVDKSTLGATKVRISFVLKPLNLIFTINKCHIECILWRFHGNSPHNRQQIALNSTFRLFPGPE